MFKYSTGFRNAILATSSAKAIIDGSYITLYSGAVPVDADASIASAVPLVVITLDGLGVSGLTMATPAVGGVLSKSVGQVWKGTIGTTGTPSFFRMHVSGDGNGASTTATRIQGTVGVAGADLNIQSGVITATEEQLIDYFSIAFPTA